MKLFSLLDTQYVNFVDRVRGYLSQMLSSYSTQFGSNTIFGQIITVVGNAMQNIMLYIEDSLVEQNKYTAQRKKSIYNLASLSGYVPSYGKASQVTIQVAFTPSNYGEFNIVLKNKIKIFPNYNHHYHLFHLLVKLKKAQLLLNY